MINFVNFTEKIYLKILIIIFNTIKADGRPQRLNKMVLEHLTRELSHKCTLMNRVDSVMNADMNFQFNGLDFAVIVVIKDFENVKVLQY